MRRRIRILGPSSAQELGSDFPNHRISYSAREKNRESAVGKKSEFPTFRLSYSNQPKGRLLRKTTVTPIYFFGVTRHVCLLLPKCDENMTKKRTVTLTGVENMKSSINIISFDLEVSMEDFSSEKLKVRNFAFYI